MVATSHELLSELTTVAASRGVALKNFSYCAKSASELFGAEVSEIGWRPDNGWAPTNPSVCVRQGRRLAVVRTVNYLIVNGAYPTMDGASNLRSLNYLVEFDGSWQPVQSTLIEDRTGVLRNHDGFRAHGFEDCRLWCGEDSYYLSASVRALCPELAYQCSEYGGCEMAILGLDEQWRIDRVDVIRDYEHRQVQKNWMPVAGSPGSFLYLCDPTIAIERRDGKTAEVARSVPRVCLHDLRGGSHLVEHPRGWLCVTHEVAHRPERVYLHRFLLLDDSFRLIALSEPFYFNRIGIEFCAGLARDGDTLVASFGENDGQAKLAFFRPDRIDRILREVS